MHQRSQCGQRPSDYEESLCDRVAVQKSSLHRWLVETTRSDHIGLQPKILKHMGTLRRGSARTRSTTMVLIGAIPLLKSEFVRSMMPHYSTHSDQQLERDRYFELGFQLARSLISVDFRRCLGRLSPGKARGESTPSI
jgi:hypothetical protein